MGTVRKKRRRDAITEKLSRTVKKAYHSIGSISVWLIMDQSRTGMNSPSGSPMTVSPPVKRHVRSSSGLSKKTQNLQAAAAAQRLAKVMAHNSGDVEDDVDDDVAIEYNVTGLGLSAGRARRPRPSVIIPPIHKPVEHPQPKSPSSVIRPRPIEPPSARSSVTSVMSSSQNVKTTEQTPSSHVIGSAGHNRPLVGIKKVHRIVSSTPVSLKQQKLGSMSIGEPKEWNSLASESRDTSALQDELDMLQEENDSLVEKLQLLEERCEEAEARAKQLETQIAKEESASALEQLQECELELRSLQFAVHRLVLTQEEMEEVVLKRCWLARYWGLSAQYGIHPDIAGDKHEYWSSWAPLPLEVVLSAGQKAKASGINYGLEEKDKTIRDVNQISGEHNVESMVLVEKGLRELASLKVVVILEHISNPLNVEDAVLLEMGQRRKQNIPKSSVSVDETKSPIELHKFGDPIELSQDEAEDVQFKLAWLTYFWRRAKNHGLEGEIAEERLVTLINQSSHTPNSHDAVDVERGLMELKKLGIDTILWEESRKSMENDSE
ncbi:hypothetical protein V2J09_008125 [Rumex salicifolius]